MKTTLALLASGARGEHPAPTGRRGWAPAQIIVNPSQIIKLKMIYAGEFRECVEFSKIDSRVESMNMLLK